jgi:hypothetical protein
MDEAKMLDQVDDYLSGRLAGDELDVFEEALLDNTVLQREVAVAQEMRRGLSEATDQLLEMRLPLLHKLHQLVRSTLWAYSSTAVAVVAAVWFASILQAPTGSLIIDEIVYVEQVRSSSSQQVHVIAKKIHYCQLMPPLSPKIRLHSVLRRTDASIQNLDHFLPTRKWC